MEQVALHAQCREVAEHGPALSKAAPARGRAKKVVVIQKIVVEQGCLLHVVPELARKYRPVLTFSNVTSPNAVLEAVIFGAVSHVGLREPVAADEGRSAEAEADTAALKIVVGVDGRNRPQVQFTHALVAIHK